MRSALFVRALLFVSIFCHEVDANYTCNLTDPGTIHERDYAGGGRYITLKNRKYQMEIQHRDDEPQIKLGTGTKAAMIFANPRDRMWYNEEYYFLNQATATIMGVGEAADLSNVTAALWRPIGELFYQPAAYFLIAHELDSGYCAFQPTQHSLVLSARNISGEILVTLEEARENATEQQWEVIPAPSCRSFIVPGQIGPKVGVARFQLPDAKSRRSSFDLASLKIIDRFPVGTNVSYFCHSGYRIVNATSVASRRADRKNVVEEEFYRTLNARCLPSGEWSAPIGSCEVISAPKRSSNISSISFGKMLLNNMNNRTAAGYMPRNGVIRRVNVSYNCRIDDLLNSGRPVLLFNPGTYRFLKSLNRWHPALALSTAASSSFLLSGDSTQNVTIRHAQSRRAVVHWRSENAEAGDSVFLYQLEGEMFPQRRSKEPGRRFEEKFTFKEVDDFCTIRLNQNGLALSGVDRGGWALLDEPSEDAFEQHWNLIPVEHGPIICQSNGNERYPDPVFCQIYYQCVNGTAHRKECPLTTEFTEGLPFMPTFQMEFNRNTGECDLPSAAKCSIVN